MTLRLRPALLTAALLAGCSNKPADNDPRQPVGPVTPRPTAQIEALDSCYARQGTYVGCVRLSRPERMQGVWVIAFETSGFVPGPPVMPRYADFAWDRTHFHLAPGVALDPAVQAERDRMDMPVAVAVEFIGRRALQPGPFGMGAASRLVVADRILSARVLGTVPH
jgi:hypothetical protein